MEGMGNAGERKGISGSTVKLVAVAAMLIDHIGAVLLTRLLIGGAYLKSAPGGEGAVAGWLAQGENLYSLYMVMRSIGRLGFPVFCFLLVEGFQRTRNVRRYGLRLGIFALISEIPFNLAITGSVTASGYQNVFFTLFLGLFVLCTFRFFERCGQAGTLGRLPGALWGVFMAAGVLLPGIYGGIWLGGRFLATGGWEVKDYLSNATPFPPRFAVVCAVLCVALAAFLFFYGRKKGMDQIRIITADLSVLVLVMYLADLLCTDYAGMGVLTIVVIYVFRRNKIVAVAVGCGVLTLMQLNEFPAFLTLVPVALYNGRRGLKMKYFFYAFYPAHLLLLYLIAVWMGLGGVSLL